MMAPWSKFPVLCPSCTAQKKQYEELYRRQHSVMERYSPLVLSNLLGAAMDQVGSRFWAVGNLRFVCLFLLLPASE